MKMKLLALIVVLSTQAIAFEFGSNDLKPESTITEDFTYNSMGCNGRNQSPEVHWSNLPAGTKSLALTLYDPTAPTGSGFWHWIVINIPVSTKSLEKGGQIPGKSIANDFGNAEYDGPCPPPGLRDTYVFTLHALKVAELPIPNNATNAIVRFYLEANTIKKVSFKTYYQVGAK